MAIHCSGSHEISRVSALLFPSQLPGRQQPSLLLFLSPSLSSLSPPNPRFLILCITLHSYASYPILLRVCPLVFCASIMPENITTNTTTTDEAGKGKSVAGTVKKHFLHTIGKITFYDRAHDDKKFVNCNAFINIKPTMHLSATNAGASGSVLPVVNTTKARSGQGELPRFTWNNPKNGTGSYALVVEDLDARVAGVSSAYMHHGLFYNIPAGRLSANNFDVEKQAGENRNRLTATALNYITTRKKDLAYLVPSPSYGHGIHRYVFTIVALTEDFIAFDRPDKVTRKDFQNHIQGKVVSFGQWIGVSKRS